MEYLLFKIVKYILIFFIGEKIGRWYIKYRKGGIK